MTRAPRAARAVRPPVAVVLGALLVSLLLGPLALLPGTTARAAALPALPAPPALPQQGSGGLAALTLALVGPLAPRGDDEVVLRGRVTNTSASTLTGVRVVLRASRDPVGSAAELPDVAADPSYRSGERTAVSALPSDFELASGQSRSWRLAVRLPDLGIVSPGVYVLGTEVLGSSPELGGEGTLALSRTVVPYEVPVTQPVPVALLWPLATQPGLLPNGRLLSDTFARQVSAPDKLPRLLTVGTGAGAPLTWVVDPDLAETARVLAASPTGTAPAGADFLRRLRAATTAPGTQALLLPYADVDATTLARSGTPGAELLSEAVARARTAAATAGLPPARVAGWPVGGVDDATLAALRTAGVDDVLAPDPGAAAAADDPDPTGGTGPGAAWTLAAGAGRPVVVPVGGSVSSALRQQRELGLSARQLRQLVLAESALAVLGSGSGTDSAAASAPPAPLVLAPDVRWRPSEASASALLSGWTDAPWATPVTLSAATRAAAAAGAAPRAADPSPATTEQTRAALSRGQADRALRLAAAVRAFSAVVRDQDPSLLRPLRDAALRATSASWRFAARTATAYVSRSAATVAFRAGQVRVATPSSITLSGSSGRFPLTVVNDLPVAALVRVQVRARNPDRLSIRSTPEVEVPAATTATVLVEATAAANGATPVSVQLLSPAGEPFGRARTMEVVATGYGLVGWIVIALASAVLLTLATVRTVRRVRARGTAASEPVAGTSAAEPAAGQQAAPTGEPAEPEPGEATAGAARPA